MLFFFFRYYKIIYLIFHFFIQVRLNMEIHIDGQQERIFQFLDPEPIHPDSIGTGDIRITSNIDSIIACSNTLEPFVCKSDCTIYKSPSKVKQSRNVKLTQYMSKRSEFHPRNPRFKTQNDNIRSNRN